MSMTAAATTRRPPCARRWPPAGCGCCAMRKSCGQSAAIRSGVIAARAPWIATLDGDGQNDPADIPRLWELARSTPSAEPLLARRLAPEAPRHGDQARLLAHRQCACAARMLERRTPDTGCGLKLLRRDLYLALPFFDHNHRFLPALVLREGGSVQSVRGQSSPAPARPIELRRRSTGSGSASSISSA